MQPRLWYKHRGSRDSHTQFKHSHVPLNTLYSTSSICNSGINLLSFLILHLKRKTEMFSSLTQWWKQETHSGPDLSHPQTAGSQSGSPGQPRCRRTPWGSRSLWPRREGQRWWTGQRQGYWAGSGQAQVGRVGIHCLRTTERQKTNAST